MIIPMQQSFRRKKIYILRHQESGIKVMIMGCCEEMHKPECHGMMLVGLGGLLIASQLWPRLNWWIILGALLIVKGVIVYFMKGCMCMKHEESEEKHHKK